MPTVIDDEFLDVDFERIFDDPTNGLCRGDIEDTYFNKLMGSFYEDAVSVMSERELRDAAEEQEENGGGEQFVSRIYDQKREGSCTYNSGGQANEMVQAKTFGLQNVVHLSAISGYKQGGRSPNSGSTVSGCLRFQQEIGFLPLDIPENSQYKHRMPNTGFYTDYPKGWKETAKAFQVEEAHVVRDPASILTALMRQEPVCVGRNGHAITYATARWVDGGWKCFYPNSWSERWGQAFGNQKGGWGVDSWTNIRRSAGWAYVVRAVTAREI